MKGKLGVLVAVGAFAMVAADARADLVSQGGGDFGNVPLYRALAFGTVNFETLNGVDYASNHVPLALANGSTRITANGAVFDATGYSAWSGFYAGRNWVDVTVTNANANDLYYEVAGQGSATSVQFFTAEAAAAYATFTWHVSGTQSNPSGIGESCPIITSTCLPAATARLDFGASTLPTSEASWLDLFEENLDQDPSGGRLASIREFGPGTYRYNLPIHALGDVINLFYWSSAFVQVNPGDAPAGSNFNVRADYFNTFVLQNVQLFDAMDNPISEWTLRDMNLGRDVFDQNGRIDPILDPPPIGRVPEPGTLALLALATLAAIGRRRRGAPAPAN